MNKLKEKPVPPKSVELSEGQQPERTPPPSKNGKGNE